MPTQATIKKKSAPKSTQDEEKKGKLIIVRTKKSLQKLTDADPLTTLEEAMLIKMLDGGNLERPQVKALFKELFDTEPQLFTACINKALNVLAVGDRDLFIERYGWVFGEDYKNILWQNNHNQIIAAISNLTLQHNRFPSLREMESETGLSRQTISKHIKEYFGSEHYQHKKDEYILMRERVLAKVFKLCLEGDVKAAKVFLMATEHMEKPVTQIRNQQNNFIQFNGTTISGEQLAQLPLDRQQQIQDIISMVTKNTFSEK